MLCISRNQCNEYDLTSAQYFSLAHHKNWCRWFAISSPLAICRLGCSFVGRVAKNEITKLQMWKLLLEGHKLSTMADALRAHPTAPLSVCSTWTVHSSVSSPSLLPMSMKKDGGQRVRDYSTLTTWASHCSWPIRNSNFFLLGLDDVHFSCLALQGPLNMCSFLRPKQFHSVFPRFIIRKAMYRGILWPPEHVPVDLLNSCSSIKYLKFLSLFPQK